MNITKFKSIGVLAAALGFFLTLSQVALAQTPARRPVPLFDPRIQVAPGNIQPPAVVPPPALGAPAARDITAPALPPGADPVDPGAAAQPALPPPAAPGATPRAPAQAALAPSPADRQALDSLVQQARSVTAIPSSVANVDLRPINMDDPTSYGQRDRTGEDAAGSRGIYNSLLQRNGSNPGEYLGNVGGSFNDRGLQVAVDLAGPECRNASGCIYIYNQKAYHIQVRNEGGVDKVYRKTPENDRQLIRLGRNWGPARVNRPETCTRAVDPTRPQNERVGRPCDTAVVLFNPPERRSPPPPPRPDCSNGYFDAAGKCVQCPAGKIAFPQDKVCCEQGESVVNGQCKRTEPPPPAGACSPFKTEPGAKSTPDKRMGEARNAQGPIGACLREMVSALNGDRLGVSSSMCDVVRQSLSNGQEGSPRLDEEVFLIRTSLCPGESMLWVKAKGGTRSFSGAVQDCFYNVGGNTGDLNQFNADKMKRGCMPCGQQYPCPQFYPIQRTAPTKDEHFTGGQN